MYKKIFISCGEYSGEVHASNLIKELKLSNNDYKIKAFGSSLIKELGVELLEDYSNYSFSGITEVINNLSKIFELKDRLSKSILEFNPDIVIMVDYGGFHNQLAKSLKVKGFQGKIVQFIAPQVWASRPWRIKNTKKYIDKVYCTLPFEEKLYQHNAINVKYVGNPVFSSLSARKNKKELGLDITETVIGVFPGSRTAEIKYMLPIMIESAKKIKESNPNRKFRFLLAKAPNLKIDTLNKYGFDKQNDIELFQENLANPNHALLSAANGLWLCSGTVTLEAAFYATPYFLSYKSTWLNYSLYRIFRTIDKAGLANIISGKNLVKEFIQHEANLENFVEETNSWFSRDGYSDYYRMMQQALQDFSQNFAKYPSYKLVSAEVAKDLNL
jgi:lipid-A-disaccharide synthase